MNLLLTRRFLPLFITQFLGAFNDNLFKNALVMLVAYKAAASAQEAQTLIVLAGALFILPYFLFSATAGQLADKFDRARLARITKLWEIIIVAIGAVGFLGHHPNFLLFVLFGLGTQSTFFGPIKYALLPQHLADDELVVGNAFIEAGTFLAILLGTICGGVLIMQEGGEAMIVAASVVVALLGYTTSWFIPKAAAPQPHLRVGWNIARETWRIVAHDRKNPRVFRCILASSWFWLVGAVFLSQFPTLVKDILRGEEWLVTAFLALFSVGIGIGSFLSNWLVHGKIDSKYVPLAAFGMAVFTLDLTFAISALSIPHIMVDLFGVALCGGIFIVPLYAIMQHDSDVNFRARTIATNNVVNALFMVASAIFTIAMFSFGGTMVHLFLLIATGNIWVGWYIRRVRKSPA